MAISPRRRTWSIPSARAASSSASCGGAAPLALLPGDVDLQQDVLHQAQLARLAADGLKQPLGVHRVDQRRLSHYLLDLVGLEVADEMDLGPGIGAGGQVSGELLDPVLAAHRNPRGDGLTDGIVRLHLGGGAQGDLPPGPAPPPGRRRRWSL